MGITSPPPRCIARILPESPESNRQVVSVIEMSWIGGNRQPSREMSNRRKPPGPYASSQESGSTSESE
eukprot:1474202-Pyramimonas_sp.AAC.1